MAHPYFSLGDALFGSGNGPQAPDLWRTSLLQQHLDPDARLALFRTFRSARDLVLATSARLSVTVNLDVAPAQLPGMLTAVRTALIHRGQPDNTVLAMNQTEGDPTPLFLAPGLLQGAIVHTLEIRLLHLHEPSVSTGFLHAVALTFPQLRVLSIGQLNGSLPAPSTLQALRELQLELNTSLLGSDAACASLAALAPQLHTLRKAGEDVLPRWDMLLTAPCPVLTCLEVDTHLTDELVQLLVQYVPALRDLSVEGLSLPDGQHRDKVWGVAILRTQDRTIDASDLRNVPLSRDGQLKVLGGSEDMGGYALWLRVEGTEGLEASLLQRMTTWALEDCTAMMIAAALDWAATEQPAGLAACIRQLSTLQAANVTHLWVRDWAWTTQLGQQLTATAAATCPTWLVGVVLRELSDAVVDCLVQDASVVQSVSAVRLHLLQDHSAQRAPWTSVFTRSDLQAGQLLNLPQVPEKTIVRLDKDARVVMNITPQQVEAGVVDRLCDKLTKFCLTSKPGVTGKAVCTNQVDVALEAQPALLRAQLRVLRAMHTQDPFATVSLEGWSFKPALLEELQGLPAWGRVLELWGGMTAYEPCDMAQLAAQVPGSYHTLVLPHWVPYQLIDVCIGLSKHQRPGKVVLKISDRDKVGFVQTYARTLGVDAEVEVSED